MKQRYYIITGTSRGLGEAIAEKLLSPENYIICIARTQNPKLQVQSLTKNGNIRDIDFDLANTSGIQDLMQEILRYIDADEVEEICLINNAGTVQPVKKVGTVDLYSRIEQNINVNLTAAILLTESFISGTAEWNVPRKVVNISTGAAKRPVEGWAFYCASKAGLEMFSQCLALEQEGAANPVRVVSYAPGIVDTEMQAEVREANQEDFPELAKFRSYKSEGQLLQPSVVADDLVKLIGSLAFGKETLVRISV